MPITGFAPALMRESSSLMTAYPARGFSRVEDLAEIDLLALRVVKAQERDLLFVGDPAGKMLERRLVDERRKRLWNTGRHGEEDVGQHGARPRHLRAAITMTREPISLAAIACSSPRLCLPPGGKRMNVSVCSSVMKYSSCAHSSSSDV